MSRFHSDKKCIIMRNKKTFHGQTARYLNLLNVTGPLGSPLLTIMFRHCTNGLWKSFIENDNCISVFIQLYWVILFHISHWARRLHSYYVMIQSVVFVMNSNPLSLSSAQRDERDSNAWRKAESKAQDICVCVRLCTTPPNKTKY